MYLRAAEGPFAPYFRGMLDDPNSLNLLYPDRLKKSWADAAEEVASFHNFTEDQKARSRELLAEADQWADYWFHAPANAQDVNKYLHDLRAAMLAERDPKALSYERERADEARKALEADRKKLAEPVIARTDALMGAIQGLATPEQKERGEYRPRTTFLDVANVLTMYGLIAMGACLILGLFTPFSALCAATFLGMIYLSMPPWPGVPEPTKVEGHYFIVSKNLIELIACLLIAATPSAHWVGLDALLFGARRRRRLARREGLAGDESALDGREPLVATRS
ncbi:DoxX family protein [Paludisphaera sp.]|uniref:DoxX family protein n=1 Tax=Paludisphaera sp. TaxID=2017432 RepID=UPI00301BE883